MRRNQPIPTVSVILLCYQQRETVLRALQSLLTQETDFPYEVVIADDGSTDGTRETLESYVAELSGTSLPEPVPSGETTVSIHSNLTIRLLPPQPNRGLVRNYFDALRRCRGKYITDCAGDDHWLGTTRLSQTVAILDSNPDVNVVFTDFLIRNGNHDTRAYSLPKYNQILPPSQIISRKAAKEYKGLDSLRGFAGDSSCPSILKGSQLTEALLNRRGSLPYLLSAAVYRRADAMEALQANEKMVSNPDFGCEDLPLMLALAARGDGVFLPEVTMVYYEGGESISNSSRASKLCDFYLRSMTATRTLADFYGYDRTRLTDWFRARSRYLASLAFKARDRRLAAQIRQELRQWSQRPDWKTRIYLLLT